MKVIGSGSPTMLTIHLETSETRLWRDELEERRAAAVRAAAHSQAPAATSRAGEDNSVERKHDELYLISRLLDDLRRHVAADQQREMAGPTWLVDQVIRGAAGEAIDRLQAALSEFTLDRGRVTPHELRAALESARASTETLIGLDYALNHAVDV